LEAAKDKKRGTRLTRLTGCLNRPDIEETSLESQLKLPDSYKTAALPLSYVGLCRRADSRKALAAEPIPGVARSPSRLSTRKALYHAITRVSKGLRHQFSEMIGVIPFGTRS
jgi:hypothetical protein